MEWWNYKIAQTSGFTFFNFVKSISLFGMYWCFAYVHVPRRPKERNVLRGLEFADGFKLPCACWRLNCNPLEEQLGS